MSLLFSETALGALKLQNRVVMCPLTRNRATDNIPNALMSQYYAQRASVGLIITEGTSPSPNGLGYPRIPGIFSDAQVAGWKPIADAVHAGGAKIFMQFMHCGRGRPADNAQRGRQRWQNARNRSRRCAWRSSRSRPCGRRPSRVGL